MKKRKKTRRKRAVHYQTGTRKSIKRDRQRKAKRPGWRESILYWMKEGSTLSNRNKKINQER